MRTVRSSGDQPIVVHDPVGRGPDVLLAHATGFHGLVWRPFARALAAHYRCWSHDFRGQGLSFVRDDHRFDWALFGDDVAAVVAGVRLRHPFGVGHSKGGAALLMAELATPGTFRALWLFEPIVLPPDTRHAVTEQTRTAGAGQTQTAGAGGTLAPSARRRRSAFPSREAAYQNYASKPPLNVFHHDALRAYVDHGFVDGLDGQVHLACRPEHEASVFEMSVESDIWARLAEVGCPVMIGVSGDATMPAEIGPRVAEQIPGARVERLDELGHFGPLQDPERVAERVRAFFSSLG